MKDGYQDPKSAQHYLDFLDSADGQIHRQILAQAILGALPAGDPAILDAACGSGWLAAELKSKYPKTYACDSSSTLIDYGKRRFPAVEFSHCDMENQLPYPPGFFDCVILNMAGPDLSNLDAALKNLAAKLKMDGRLILTVPNPYLTYPVMVWKRSVWDILLRRKPKLKTNSAYFGTRKTVREFGGKNIASNS